MDKSIGLVEFLSVARGIRSIDAMLKAAEVELIASKPLCPGKFLGMVAGETAAVTSSVEAGVADGGEFVVGYTIIPNVHELVFPAIWGTAQYDLKSIGVIEVFNVATAIRVADAAVKSAEVQLIEIRLSVGLGGKAFIVLTGEVAAVQNAVDVGSKLASLQGELVSDAVIPAPHKQLGDAISSPV